MTKSTLTKEDLVEVKKKLLAEKAEMETELAKISTKNPHSDDNLESKFEDYGADESDNASEVANYSLNLSLEKTLEKTLKDVKKSLESLAKGTYGICKYCKNPIDRKRLLARPTSSACVTCKTKLKSL